MESRQVGYEKLYIRIYFVTLGQRGDMECWTRTLQILQEQKQWKALKSELTSQMQAAHKLASLPGADMRKASIPGRALEILSFLSQRQARGGVDADIFTELEKDFPEAVDLIAKAVHGLVMDIEVAET